MNQRSYKTSNLAYKINRETIINKKDKRKKLIISLFLLLFTMSSLFMLLSAKDEFFASKLMAIKLEKRLSGVNRDIAVLNEEVNKNVDLQEIAEIASKRLKMKKLTNKQIVRYSSKYKDGIKQFHKLTD